MYQIKGGQTQDDFFAESGHEHSHEADAGEIGNAAHTTFVCVNGNTEQVPCTFFCLAVAELYAGLALVGNVVASNHHVLWTDAYAVLVVLFIFVQRIVLVDVLDVWRALPCRFIAFGVGVAVRAVALGHVDALVAVKDAGLRTVEIRSAVIVVVVVCGVGLQAVIHLRIDTALHLGEELLIGGK